MNAIGGEELSSIQFQDLINMIRNAEKSVLLLNEARVQALEDLNKIRQEKEAPQGEINVLELKLAETDAKIKVAHKRRYVLNFLKTNSRR